MEPENKNPVEFTLNSVSVAADSVEPNEPDIEISEEV